jgi:hypothetical protein
MVGKSRKFEARHLVVKSAIALLRDENARLRAKVDYLERQLSEANWAAQNASQEHERQSYSDWDRMGK